VEVPGLVEDDIRSKRVQPDVTEGLPPTPQHPLTVAAEGKAPHILCPMPAIPGSDTTDWLCYGSSGTCVQVARDVMFRAAGRARLVAFVDDLDNGHLHPHEGLPVIGFEELASSYRGASVFVAVQSPAGREAVFGRLAAAGIPIVGARPPEHLAHPTADFGEGAIAICTARIGPGSSLGRGVLALGDLVAHDVEVGEFTTCAPGSNIAGHVRIGRRVWVGMGAVVSNGTSRRPIVIGDDAVIGAGAVVDRDVAPGEVVVGNRAMTLREWLRLRRFARRESR
jgi:sugar O-acyltransferase (sialic acid O-acetyltransferase NeuD family)